MGFSLKKVAQVVGAVGGVVAAPFTGGASLALTAAAIGSATSDSAANQAKKQQNAAIAAQNSANNAATIEQYKAAVAQKIDTASPEYRTFMDFAASNKDPAAVQEQALKAINDYNTRTGLAISTGSSLTSLNLPNVSNIQPAAAPAATATPAADMSQWTMPLIFGAVALVAIVAFLALRKR